MPTHRAMRLTVLVSLITSLALAGAAVSQAAVAWHTKAQAERNILNAPRALARWNKSLVNPETHLVRRNVAVACSGVGRERAGRFNRFECVVRYRLIRVKMTYLALFSNGFELLGRAPPSR
jgi:hypothetical protein